MGLKELFTSEKLENAKTGLKWLSEIAPDLKNSVPAIKAAMEIFKTNNPYENFMQNNQNLLGQQAQVQSQAQQSQAQQPQPQPQPSQAEIEKDKKMDEILNNSPELLKIRNEILEAQRANNEKEKDLIQTLENLYEQQKNPNNKKLQQLEQELQLFKNKFDELENKITPISAPNLDDDFVIPILEEEELQQTLENAEDEPLIATPIELEKPYNNHKNYKKNGGKN